MMKLEVLLALLTKKVEDRLAAIPQPSSGMRGPRGPRGQRGSDGQGFVFSEHEETIKTLIQQASPKFEDFTEEQINLLRGPKGRDGADGQSFVFSDHEEEIKDWCRQMALKFDDLTEEQIAQLRGPRGLDGRDGSDGKDFDFESSRESITEVVSRLLEDMRDSLKLRFDDLNEDDIDKLRGPRGRDGHDGRDFVFEEHREYFESLRPKFSDFTDEEKQSLRFRWQDFTDENKAELKLKFEDLSDDDKAKIRGARGPKGQRGSPGLAGNTGPQGPRGVPGQQGIRGIQGPAGIDGVNGQDGRDGKDAPYITDIRLEIVKNEASFVFEFSDGTRIETNSFKIPTTNVYTVAGGMAVRNGGGSGTGQDGKSAYEVAVDNGFVGTESEWLDSLVGPQGPQGDPGPAGADGATGADGADGDSAYQVAVNNGFVGTEAEWLDSLVGPPGPGSAAVQVLENVPCDASVYVGAAVIMQIEDEVELSLSDWPTLSSVLTMDVSDTTSVAYNGLADEYANSNVIGIVESKADPTHCDIRITGLSGNNYLGLDVTEEYYLSDTSPGQIVPLSLAPTVAGSVLVKIGQPFSGTKLLYQRGERVIRGV